MEKEIKEVETYDEDFGPAPQIFPEGYYDCIREVSYEGGVGETIKRINNSPSNVQYKILNAEMVTSRKLIFYQEKKIRIKFNLLFKPEYEICGTVSGLQTDLEKKMATPYVSITDKETEIYININEIDPQTIFPENINPIKLFVRGYISDELRKKVFERDNYECKYKLWGCTKKAEEVDHIIPVAKGGLTIEDNLISACLNCNRKKGTKIINPR